jgi:transcriptional regulator with XRE-family HTH domain
MHTETSIRDCAMAIGINISTLSRIENGKAMSGDALKLVLSWLMGAERSK